MMKIGVLTSSRADFGIYLPLLKEIQDDYFFELEVIAFGTHLSKYHGYTLDQVTEHDFKTVHEISTLLTNDNENSISTAFGLTVIKFADFWKIHKYDLVLCLGDRFEMAAAVQAGIPFGIEFAHFHGGETTLGAIDNIYRHQISLASSLHFPSTDFFAEKIRQLTSMKDNIFVVGSLSIDRLENLPIPDEASFREQYKIYGNFVLSTFHPETISREKNILYSVETKKALSEISKAILLVITLPNADTYGTVFRKVIYELEAENPGRIILIENFGKINYFAAMKYCELLLGNTSSGIIEAATLGKYVINVGERQKGRLQSQNIVNVPFDAQKIIEATSNAMSRGNFLGINIYHKRNTVDLILKHLKNYKR